MLAFQHFCAVEYYIAINQAYYGFIAHPEKSFKLNAGHETVFFGAPIEKNGMESLF
jgi:hypothetical protein